MIDAGEQMVCYLLQGRRYSFDAWYRPDTGDLVSKGGGTTGARGALAPLGINLQGLNPLCMANGAKA